MTLLGYIVLSLTILGGTALAFRSPWHTLLISFALLPWFGLSFDVGIRFTLYQLFMLPLIIVYFFRGLPTLASAQRQFNPLILLLVYTAALALVMLPQLPDIQVQGGILRTPAFRSGVQFLANALTVATAFLAAHVCRSHRQLHQLMSAFVTSSLLLALIGYLQLAVWYRTGENPIPIEFFDTLMTGRSLEARSGIFMHEGISIYRMSSFGGEPKNLGQALVSALLLMIWIHSVEKKPFTFTFLLKSLFLLIGAFLSQSTSSFIFLASALAGMLILLSAPGQQGVRATRVLMLGFAFVAIGPMLVQWWLGLPLFDLVVARTSGRFGQSQFGLFDDFDVPVLDFLLDNPLALIFGVGLGNVHLFADAYLAPEIALFASGTSFSAKMGLLRMVAETGVIGLSLIAWFIMMVWRTATRQRVPEVRALMLVGFVGLVFVNLTTLFFVIAGAIVGALCDYRYPARTTEFGSTPYRRV